MSKRGKRKLTNGDKGRRVERVVSRLEEAEGKAALAATARIVQDYKTSFCLDETRKRERRRTGAELVLQNWVSVQSRT